MAKLKPWYQVVTPRADLRDNRPLDASEFAVHLDHVRLGRATAPPDYVDPAMFFERTYLTSGLRDLATQMARRLNGIKVATSAIFNLTTEFGGGKTHALTALFHLARSGATSSQLRGVDEILKAANVLAIPQTATAVFVGTEFSVLNGRGDPGEPTRRTPWGEIAWQLGQTPDEQRTLFAAVARHDELGIAPAGDDIRRMLPSGPTLILMDELLNYLSSGRKLGLRDQFFNFLQNLCEEARARDNLVLCVSIPRAEIEMNPDDRRDQEAIQKLCDRLGKAVRMTADCDLSEILRRRLFEWDGLPREAEATIAAHADWATRHAHELVGVEREAVYERFKECYPFHPTVISLFERKWHDLPHFQRTRGVLRMLALWVADNFQKAHRKRTAEPLITLGLAPWEHPFFRAAVFEQLAATNWETAIAVDIVGNATNSHCEQLDAAATEAIRQSQLHRKVASTIFWESAGGQCEPPFDASLSEIMTAVGEPGLHVADVETVLSSLVGRCFYLHAERGRYRCSLTPNLNQLLVARRGSVKDSAISERLRERTVELFRRNTSEDGKFLDRVYFPERSNDVREVPKLTLVVLGCEHVAEAGSTLAFIESIVRHSGTKDRTLKSALLLAAAHPGEQLANNAREVLAWEEINADSATTSRLDDGQRSALNRSLQAAQRELDEAIVRAYRHLYWLSKDNALRHLDLGNIDATTMGSLAEVYLRRLGGDGGLDEIVAAVPVRKLVSYWPAAQVQWSTNSVRAAFYSSPLLPRLLNVESLKRTLADGVRQGVLRYAVQNEHGRLQFLTAPTELAAEDIEFSDDVFILKAADAAPTDSAPATNSATTPFATPVAMTAQPMASATGDDSLSWQGLVPSQKWMTFYTRVLSRFVGSPDLKVEVRFDVSVPAEMRESKLHEVQSNLRDLGLNDDVQCCEAERGRSV